MLFNDIEGVPEEVIEICSGDIRDAGPTFPNAESACIMAGYPGTEAKNDGMHLRCAGQVTDHNFQGGSEPIQIGIMHLSALWKQEQYARLRIGCGSRNRRLDSSIRSGGIKKSYCAPATAMKCMVVIIASRALGSENFPLNSPSPRHPFAPA